MKFLRTAFIAGLLATALGAATIRTPVPGPIEVLCGCICADGSLLIVAAGAPDQCPKACARACDGSSSTF